MPDYEQAVFISYAWGEENEIIVNQLDQALQERGLKIQRDKRDLEYRGSIKAFMERIGRGDCIIVVISDKYLKSPNCMFELVEIADKKQFENRIFPIVLSDANIYDPIGQTQYIKHWEAKYKELDASLEGVRRTYVRGITEQLKLYERIGANISELTAILGDMNALTPDMHHDSDFSHIYDAIEKRMKAFKKVDNGTISSEVPAPDRTTNRLRTDTGKSKGVSSAQQKKRTSRQSSSPLPTEEELLISRRLLGELNDAQRQLNEFIDGYIMLIEPWVDCGIAKSKLEEENVSENQYWREIKTLLRHARSKINEDIPSSLKSINAFGQFNGSLLEVLQLVETISPGMTESERMEINNFAFDCLDNAVLMVEAIVAQCQKGANEKIGQIKGLISGIFEPDQELNKASLEQAQKPSKAIVRPRGSPKPSDNLLNRENRQVSRRRLPAR
jgi:hypothetical protein